MKVSVEVVCARVEEAVAAEQVGADRIELVSSISAGGLTPSIGCVQLCLERTRIPIVPILRPREGGFFYSQNEFDTIRRDLESFVHIGVKHFSVGVLARSGVLDVEKMRRLRDAAPDAEWMCHRAFDLTPDLTETLERLIELGFSRVLTGGGKTLACDGIETLGNLERASTSRIQIVAAGGVRATNVSEIISEAGVRHVHLGPTVEACDPTSKLSGDVNYGTHQELNAQDVRNVIDNM